MDCLSLLFSGALVIIGALGVGFAIKTLRAIERQAKANEDQLTEIQQSAEKTDRMILLTAQQAENGRIATEAAKQSAEAAKASADAVINSERAWVMVDIEWDKTMGGIIHSSAGKGQSIGLATTLICTNHGSLPAWITMRKIQVEITSSLASLPDLESPQFSNSYIPLASRQKHESPWHLTGKGWPESGQEIFIYGVVQYSDVFGSDRETWFGYLAAQNRELIRIPQHAYNKHT